MNNLKIYTTYHDNRFINEYNLKNDDIHILYNVNDNPDGYNINNTNILLNEFVTMYYVWKNNKYSEFIGFEHYNKRFNVNNIPQKLDKNCCYGFFIIKHENIFNQYIYTLKSRKMLIDTINILYSKFGHNNKYIKYIMSNNSTVLWKEGYIMHWDNFIKMIPFIWDIITTLDNKVHGNNFNIETYKQHYNIYTWYDIRVGHIIERLISAWIFCNYDEDNIIQIQKV